MPCTIRTPGRSISRRSSSSRRSRSATRSWSGATDASAGAVTCFVAGLALILAVFVTPLHPIALHYLLSIHLLQNVVLAEWAPALCVHRAPGRDPPVAAPADAPVRRAAALGRDVLRLARPGRLRRGAPAPGVAAAPRARSRYFVTGLLFWWPALQDEPHRLTAGARAMYLFAAFVVASPLGLLLALIPRPVYDYYVQAPTALGLSPLTDQQIGGARDGARAGGRPLRRRHVVLPAVPVRRGPRRRLPDAGPARPYNHRGR